MIAWLSPPLDDVRGDDEVPSVLPSSISSICAIGCKPQIGSLIAEKPKATAPISLSLPSAGSVTNTGEPLMPAIRPLFSRFAPESRTKITSLRGSHLDITEMISTLKREISVPLSTVRP